MPSIVHGMFFSIITNRLITTIIKTNQGIESGIIKNRLVARITITTQGANANISNHTNDFKKKTKKVLLMEIKLTQQ